MDLITAELAALNEKIEKLEARRDAETSEAMRVAYTGEIAALRNQAAALENRAAAQFPAGMMNFSQRSFPFAILTNLFDSFLSYLLIPHLYNPHLTSYSYLSFLFHSGSARWGDYDRY